MTPIPAIVGPTASGKTALAIALAQRLGGEIVGCDSMQIYREMDIGTAKPTAEERAAIPHHMIDFVPPGRPYSAADYATDALACIKAIRARGRVPVLCGGTGLYLSSLRRGGAPVESPPADPVLRAELAARAELPGGREELHAALAAVDPDAAAATHPNNLRRVIRALEIYRTSGRTKSEWDRLSREGERGLPLLPIGLRFQDRSLLADRIARRVASMMADGLVEEARRLFDAGLLAPTGTAAQAIGYKELLPYLRGEITLAAATESLVTATRRYAKRQMTWFAADPSVIWLTVDRPDGSLRTADDLCDEAEALLRNAENT